jgi:CRP/FNR family cyclic AMP-dependent transcriptional regulator
MRVLTGLHVMSNAQSAALIDTLTDPLLRALASRGQIRRFPRNAVVISEGEEGNVLYIILSGHVKVYSSNSQGKEVVLDTYGPGEYVGEMALDAGARSASVITVEPCACAVVTRSALAESVVQNPTFAVNLISELIRRLRTATENVKRLALMDVYGRVAHLLLSLTTERDGKGMVKERLSQREIANRVGASREMVNRVVKSLSAGGYISVSKGRITVNRQPPQYW